MRKNDRKQNERRGRKKAINKKKCEHEAEWNTQGRKKGAQKIYTLKTKQNKSKLKTTQTAE